MIRTVSEATRPCESMVAKKARELMDQWGLEDWKFKWNNRKRSFGVCRYGKKEICLSRYLLNDDWEDTVRHEIAHAKAGPYAKHGPEWKAWCYRVGARPNRCSTAEIENPCYKWVTKCGQCGKEGVKTYRRRTGLHRRISRCCQAELKQERLR